jgi:hypothetical protein
MPQASYSIARLTIPNSSLYCVDDAYKKNWLTRSDYYTILSRIYLMVTKCQQIPYIDCQANDALDQMSYVEYGVHYIIIYPDLFTLRELYSAYVLNTLRRIMKLFF